MLFSFLFCLLSGRSSSASRTCARATMATLEEIARGPTPLRPPALFRPLAPNDGTPDAPRGPWERLCDPFSLSSEREDGRLVSGLSRVAEGLPPLQPGVRHTFVVVLRRRSVVDRLGLVVNKAGIDSGMYRVESYAQGGTVLGSWNALSKSTFPLDEVRPHDFIVSVNGQRPDPGRFRELLGREGDLLLVIQGFRYPEQAERVVEPSG